RIMVMNKGEVQQIGTPYEIYHRPVNRFVASFIGETNLWEGTVASIDGDQVSVQISPGLVLVGLKQNASTQAQLKVGQKTVISIRPEALHEVPLSDWQKDSNV
ncbi:hypothetical protein MXD63_43070, partial [Frankia sp. Cpl3]|nr:hypothetical protein [Frankia sp. Cpl3]